MIGIIDYGSGNIKSIINVIDQMKINYTLSNNIKELSTCNKILLPGVGEANYAMNKLKELNLVDFIKNLKTPLLGICLGLQLLTDSSEEGETECLGIINVKTVKFNDKNLIIPHMGWNDIKIISENRLLKGVNSGSDFYFANSYYAPINKYTIAVTNYGVDFSVVINKDNFWGVQFHPEKSGKNGIKILENFFSL